MGDDAGAGVPAAGPPLAGPAPQPPQGWPRRAFARYVLAVLAVVAAVSGGVAVLPGPTGRTVPGAKLAAPPGAPLTGPLASRHALAGTVAQRSSRTQGGPGLTEYRNGTALPAAGPYPTELAAPPTAVHVADPGPSGKAAGVPATGAAPQPYALPVGRAPPVPARA